MIGFGRLVRRRGICACVHLSRANLCDPVVPCRVISRGGIEMATNPGQALRLHNHGTIKVGAKMRCGVGEGISVLNSNSDKVAYLYTDGVTSCVQVTLRNDRATFTSHLM